MPSSWSGTRFQQMEAKQDRLLEGSGSSQADREGHMDSTQSKCLENQVQQSHVDLRPGGADGVGLVTALGQLVKRSKVRYLSQC